MSLAAPAGSSVPSVQSVAVASGTQGVSYDASVRYLSSATGWLSVTPPTGAVPATLVIAADASNLKAGTYLAQVTVSAGPQQLGTYVDVFFTVGTVSGASTLAVDQSGLTFLGFSEGDILPSQELSVTNAEGASEAIGFTAYATSSGNWLMVSPISGTTPQTLTVSAIQGSLTPGNYTGTVTITPAAGGAPIVVPVTLAATGSSTATPALILSQSALNINYQTGTSAPPSQLVFVDTTEDFIDYTASTTDSWISLTSDINPTPASSVTGVAPGDLTVIVHPAGLPLGKNVGTITIDAPGLPSQQIPVSLTVTNSAALNADASSVSFDYLNGFDITGPQTVTVTSTGTSILSFTVTASTAAADGPWLSVAPSSGSTAGGSEDLTIGTNASSMAAGTYHGTITLAVQGSSATFTIPVVLNVSGTAGSTLQVLTDSLDLVGLVGGASPSRKVDIGQYGSTQNFTATASSTGGWLMVTPFSGMAPATLTISANPAAVPGPGDYDGSVVVTSLDTGSRTRFL